MVSQTLGIELPGDRVRGVRGTSRVSGEQVDATWEVEPLGTVPMAMAAGRVRSARDLNINQCT
jgi:hypothetical protein